MNYSQKYTGNINIRDSSSLLDTSFITDSKILTFSSSIGIKKVDWNGYFLSEKNASLSGNLHFIKDSFSEAEDKSYHGEAIGINITLQQAIIPSIRLLSSVAAAYSHNSSFYNWFSGSNVGISILPDNFSTPKIAATTIGFESMMFRTSWSLFSAYALYECTWLENSDNEIVFEHGPKTGIKMYLSKIAFPAFAFGICYNISHARMQYAISFGASM